MQRPFIGETVHYRSFGTPGGEYPMACRAAIVTEEHKPRDGYPKTLALAVLNPTGMFFNTGIPQDESRENGGTWHFVCQGD